MQPPTFSHASKLEVVNLFRNCGDKAARAACDLDIQENVLRKWVEELSVGLKHAFPAMVR
jgi:transposase